MLLHNEPTELIDKRNNTAWWSKSILHSNSVEDGEEVERFFKNGAMCIYCSRDKSERRQRLF